MMINKSETVLASLTNEALQVLLTSDQPGVVYRANALLSIPAEYRQGVEARHHQLMFNTFVIYGSLEELRTHASFESTYDRVLFELRTQLGDAV